MTISQSALTPRNSAGTAWNMDNIATFDLEAHDWDEVVAVGLLWPDGTYEEFTNDECDPIAELTDRILSRKARNMTFVAHNGGNYDFQEVIAEVMTRDRSDVSVPTIATKGNGEVFRVRLDRHYGDQTQKRYLQDSFHLLLAGLKDLSESFLPEDEHKGDFDFNRLEPEWSDMTRAAREDCSAYLKRDCESLRGVLRRFTDIIHDLTDGAVGPQFTAGSTTMAAYQCAFMADEDVNRINPSPAKAEAAFRDSYFGGRTEVFKMFADADEHGDLYYYDVNSLYPHAYTNFDLPSGSVYHLEAGEDQKDKLLKPDNDNFGGAVKITGTVPDDVHIPVLPAKVPTDDYEKVVFPVGEIEGWYMLREVRYAMQAGALEDVTVHDGWICTNQRPFGEYGSTLYTLKQEIDKSENPAKYNVVKLLLNSFYGKFGMDRDQANYVQLGPDERLSEEMQERDLEAVDDLTGYGVCLEHETADSSYILPRVASAITAQARIEMHKWLAEARERGGDVWYCDTDSIVTNVELPESEKLGGMDLEHRVDEAYFLRPKTYAMKTPEDDEDVIKGKGMKALAKETTIGDRTFEAKTVEDFRLAYERDEPDRIESGWTGPVGFAASFKDDPTQGLVKTSHNRSLQGFDDKRHHVGNESEPRFVFTDDNGEMKMVGD